MSPFLPLYASNMYNSYYIKQDMEKVHMIHLVKQAQQGDADAYSELIHIHQDSFYRIARSRLYNDEDAADAIQETLLTGWEKCRTLKEPKYFKTWMIRILINKCNDILRKKLPTDNLENIPEPCADDMEENIMFKAMLKELSKPNQMVMALYYGYTIRVISQILEISENAVKQRLVRGRKEALKSYEND